MIWTWAKRILAVLLVTLVVGASLFGEHYSRGFNISGAVGREMLAVFRDPGTQWMVFLCAAIYFVTFTFLGKRRVRNETRETLKSLPALNRQQSFINLFSPDLWLYGLLLFAALAYAFDYEKASTSTQALVLLVGAALGKGVRLWAGWEKKGSEGGGRPKGGTEDVQPSACNFQPGTKTGLFLSVLLGLLGVAALWHPEGAMQFQYRGLSRWSGPWDNPNTFGMLMGTGVIIGVGLGISGFASRLSGWVAWKLRVWVAFVLVCAVFCGIGLIKSYSRGAWLGAMAGLAALAFQFLKFQRLGFKGGNDSKSGSRISRLAVWIQRNAWPLLALGIALVVIAFWEFRQTEWHPARRAFSVGNRNDFSWRNRVAAWEGALVMMADRPFVGFGWNQPEKIYDQFYRPAKVSEGMAIQLNHYFTLGMSLGLPALICFGMYVGLSLTRKAECVGRNGTEASWQIDSKDFQWICRSAAVVLLVGLWFDGGLFNLATAAPLWMLLELGQAGRAPSGVRSVEMENLPNERGEPRPIVSNFSYKQYVFRFQPLAPLFLGLLLLTSLIWAGARDPFHREWLRVRTSEGGRLNAVAVMPDQRGPFPVILFAHGSGGSAESSGEMLQRFATLGFAAVGIEYDKANQARFDAQFAALLDQLAKKGWTRSNSIAWVGQSLGAQRQLSFLARHPERRPAALVLLNGGMVAELEGGGTNTHEGFQRSSGIFHLPPTSFARLPVWLAHGDEDETFPASDARRIGETLRSLGAHVRLDIFPGRRHVFGEDQALLVKAAGEFCARELEAKAIVPDNVRPVFWYFWLPAGMWGCALLLCYGQRCNPERGAVRANLWLWISASVVVIVATLISAAHLALPMSRATPAKLKLARQWCVRPELRADYDWLAQQPDAKGQRIGDLLEQVTLASLQRSQFAASLSEHEWREFVLSPWVSQNGADIGWRRELWEWLAPRVRRETGVELAAIQVARQLRLRVGLTTAEARARDVLDTWKQGRATKAGYERLTVAGMRAAGIPARLDVAGRCEILDDGRWKPVPLIQFNVGERN